MPESAKSAVDTILTESAFAYFVDINIITIEVPLFNPSTVKSIPLEGSWLLPFVWPLLSPFGVAEGMVDMRAAREIFTNARGVNATR